jgi:hypothetical protein
LWRGHWQNALDKILGVLDRQAIPSHFREIINTAPTIAILGIRVAGPKWTFEYEVWVLKKDLERAQSAAAGLLQGSLPAEEITRNDAALDFAGAFVDGENASVAVEAFNIGFA